MQLNHSKVEDIAVIVFVEEGTKENNREPEITS
jgi:hypothetical protein